MKPARRGLLKAAFALSLPVATAAGTGTPKPGSTTGPAAKLALALGSGSYHGHALIGALRVFERRGVRPDLVVGTSVGAMVGALWASGMDCNAIEKAAARFTLWRSVKLAWPDLGLFTNEGLQETIHELVRGRPIESWPMRFAAVASDLATGERVVIDRGDAAVAVAASASMPVICRPVAWRNRLLVDGALTEPVPAKAARELGGQRVVGIDIAYRPANAPVESVAGSAFQSVHILVNSLITEQSPHADVAIHLQLHALVEGREDYGRALMEVGARAIEAAWERIVAP